MELAYLIVSTIVIGGFIAFQYAMFPAYGWETYVGLTISLCGCVVALIRTVA